MKGGGGADKLERKTVEKNRRIHMKNLCVQLTSLIPKSKQRATMTQQDLLEQATHYVNELKERVERLKQKKEKTSGVLIGFGEPLVTVTHLGSNLVVNLVCGLRTRSMLHPVIIVLLEEGADVTSASSNIVGDKIFHTVHCQAIYPRIGLDPSRVEHRLKEIVRREA
ncbi:transcription factor bHLH168-like isoform X1 [Musa acuminata AAA Group]|uniref:transcription factor bHLH168-like isoform X1 n=1 Tax=Musa acuminata AAA Group TaxID=214697 RepID=UPI0031D446C2